MASSKNSKIRHKYNNSTGFTIGSATSKYKPMNLLTKYVYKYKKAQTMNSSLKKKNYSAYLSHNKNHAKSITKRKPNKFMITEPEILQHHQSLNTNFVYGSNYVSVQDTPNLSNDSLWLVEESRSQFTNKDMSSPNSVPTTMSRVYRSKPTIVSVSLNSYRTDRK